MGFDFGAVRREVSLELVRRDGISEELLEEHGLSLDVMNLYFNPELPEEKEIPHDMISRMECVLGVTPGYLFDVMREGDSDPDYDIKMQIKLLNIQCHTLLGQIHEKHQEMSELIEMLTERVAARHADSV